MNVIVPISELPEAIDLEGDELVPIVQGGITKRTTVAAIRAKPTIKVSPALLEFPDTDVGDLSSDLTFEVSGIYLVDDITITPPTDWLLSLDNITYSGVPIILSHTGGVVSETTVYSKFEPASDDAYDENITLASTGATTKNVNVTGTGILVNLGVIYDYNSFPNLANFSNGSGNFSAAGGQIIVTNPSSPSSGLFASRLSYNVGSYTSNLETWKQTVVYDIGSKDGFGLGLGVDTVFGPMCGLLFLNTNPGRLTFFDVDSGNPLVSSNPLNDIVINNNDIIELTLENVRGNYTLTAVNQTTPGTVTVSHSYALTFPITYLPPANFSPSIYGVGGTQYVDSWKYESDARVGAKWMFIGDSLTVGLFAVTEAQRWGTICAGSDSYNIYAGQGLTTQDMLLSTAEMVALAPDNAVILLTSNDRLQNVNEVDTVARLTTMVTSLQGAGVNVVLANAPPVFETTARDTVSLTTLMEADVVLGPLVLIDAQSFSSSAPNAWDLALTPDKIHGNVAWNALMGAAAAASI